MKWLGTQIVRAVESLSWSRLTEPLLMEKEQASAPRGDGAAGDYARHESGRRRLFRPKNAQSEFDGPMVCWPRLVESLEDCLAAELLRPFSKLTKTTRVSVNGSAMNQFGCGVVQVLKLVVVGDALVLRRRHVQGAEQ